MSDRVPQPQEKFIVRLPDGMRERIKVAAEANGRSMNAEIVARLKNSFDLPDYDLREIARRMADDTIAEVRKMLKEDE